MAAKVTVSQEKKYSPAECTGIKKARITGDPNPIKDRIQELVKMNC
jgi:hypothetical protein